MTETTAVHVPAPRAEDSLLESSCRAFFATWSTMALSCPTGSYHERDGVARVRTQLPAAPFNGVWGLTPDVDAGAVLAAVDEFAAGALPWNLQLRPGYPAALDEELAGRGLVPTAAIPFMLLRDGTTARQTGSTAHRLHRGPRSCEARHRREGSVGSRPPFPQEDRVCT